MEAANGSQSTVCPSGLRGWTQVPLVKTAWVQIPQLSHCFQRKLQVCIESRMRDRGAPVRHQTKGSTAQLYSSAVDLASKLVGVRLLQKLGKAPELQDTRASDRGQVRCEPLCNIIQKHALLCLVVCLPVKSNASPSNKTLSSCFHSSVG